MRLALPILALLAAAAVTIGQVYVLDGHLPPLGGDDLDWAVAIARVVDANPGGIVELAEWLP